MPPFGKHQHAIAAIDCLARIRKASPESRLARQRKQIQQRHSQSPLHPIINFQEKCAIRRGRAQSFQRLAASRDCQVMSKASGKRRQNKSGIDVPNMIGHHQQRSLYSAQMLATFYTRPAQQHDRRTHQQIVRKKSKPGHGPAQHPSWIVIGHARRCFSPQHALQIAHGSHRTESCFAQIHLVPVLDCAQQFHAIERTQPQVGIEAGVLIQSTNRAPRYPLDQIAQRAITGCVGAPFLARCVREKACPEPVEGRGFVNHFPDGLSDLISFRLLRTRPRKILLWPLHPHAHALIFRQRLVRPLHHVLGQRSLTQKQRRASFRIPVALDSHHHAIPYLRLLPQRLFQILRINIRPTGRDNDLFLAALEIKISGLVQSANVARAVPSGLIQHPMSAACIPVPGSHASAAHQNLAIIRQLHLPTRQHFANRSLAQSKWMIHADQRSRLREPVALNHRVSQPIPEFLGLAVESRAARDHRPEFPAKLPANRAEGPPAAQKMLRLRSREFVVKGFDLPLTFQLPLDLLLQRLQHPRHAHQH